MITADKVRQLETDKELIYIEKEIISAVKFGDTSIRLSMNNFRSRDLINKIENYGFNVKMGGCSGWDSQYYTISW